MAEVLLFHHIQGLTPGVIALADQLRAAGHTVHTPDLYGGRTFASIEEGAAFAQGDDAPDVAALADAAAAELPAQLVYAGISAGVVHAQRLAQTRAGAAGAVLMESCLPITGQWAFGDWPAGVAVQIHGMDDDEYFAGEGDVEAAREIVKIVGPSAELFVPGTHAVVALSGGNFGFADPLLDAWVLRQPGRAPLIIPAASAEEKKTDPLVRLGEALFFTTAIGFINSSLHTSGYGIAIKYDKTVYISGCPAGCLC